MRRPVIAGNWKMFKTRSETSAFFTALIPLVRDVEHCDIVVAPPFTALSTAVDQTEGTRVAISAQNVHWEDQGAFTGEVSVRMLSDAGCTYVIVGHSERRQYFGETDDWVEKKTRAVVKGGLKAIVCVGETLSERDAGQALDVVRRQVRSGLGRSFRRRRLTGDIRRTRHRYPIEQSHHGCRGHLHVHVAVADDSDLAARRLVCHPRRSATKESAAGPAGSATGHTAGPAARSTAGATGSTGPAASCSAAATTAEEHAGSARNSSEKVAAGKKALPWMACARPWMADLNSRSGGIGRHTILRG